MTIVWKEDLLREAAGQMAVQTARLLPREEAPLSPPFQEKMGELLWRTKRQQKRRVIWQRAIAALLALVVAMGAVLAVSPQAQAAAKRWLMKITDVVTTYQFYPTAEETVPWDGLPQWTGEGYELAYDLNAIEEELISSGAMVRASSGQTIYLDLSEGDHVVYYEAAESGISGLIRRVEQFISGLLS